MKITDEVWKTEALSKTFLEGVRGAIPLAAEQTDVMLRIIRTDRPNIERILELGCGDGILGQAVLTQYPDAEGVFLDFSEAMIQAAKTRLSSKHKRVEFIIQDFGKPEWVNAVQDKGLFDVIVSGFAIHHQPHERKSEIYQELLELLKPGGIFINIEHIASSSRWVEGIANEFFVDSLYKFHQNQGLHKSRSEIAQEYYNRPDKEANILEAVETQCDWLRNLGFIRVDCYMKIFELAVFGGIRPHETS